MTVHAKTKMPAVETEASVKDLFGLDGRAIEFFRRALALVALYDLFVRAKDFTKFYTDAGVFPIETQAAMHPHGILINLYAWFHSPIWPALLMLISAALCLALAVGRGNRWAWLAQWVLLLSLHNRISFVNQGGDIMLRLFFFWGIFLPWQNRGRFCTPATLALTLQIAFVYFFAALLKSGADWHGDGTAIFYALRLDKFATPLGLWMRQFPAVLSPMTQAVWYWELLGPVLLFSPFFFARARTAATLGFMALHLGFVFTLCLGTFPWICLAGLTVLLPTAFWDAIETIRARPFFPRARAAEWAMPRAVRMFGNAIVMAALFGVFLCNLASLKSTKIELPRPFARVMYPLGLIQKWEMFAPAPPHSSNWLAIEVVTEDGTAYDVSRGLASEPKSARPEKPQWLSYQYSSERELKYVESLAHPENGRLRGAFIDYLCTQWKDRVAGRRLKSIRLTYVAEPVLSALVEKRRRLGGKACPR